MLHKRNILCDYFERIKTTECWEQVTIMVSFLVNYSYHKCKISDEKNNPVKRNQSNYILSKYFLAEYLFEYAILKTNDFAGFKAC